MHLLLFNDPSNDAITWILDRHHTRYTLYHLPSTFIVLSVRYHPTEDCNLICLSIPPLMGSFAVIDSSLFYEARFPMDTEFGCFNHDFCSEHQYCDTLCGIRWNYSILRTWYEVINTRMRLAWTTWTCSREIGLQFEREERPILWCALRLPFVRHFFGSTCCLGYGLVCIDLLVDLHFSRLSSDDLVHPMFPRNPAYVFIYHQVYSCGKWRSSIHRTEFWRRQSAWSRPHRLWHMAASFTSYALRTQFRLQHSIMQLDQRMFHHRNPLRLQAGFDRRSILVKIRSAFSNDRNMVWLSFHQVPVVQLICYICARQLRRQVHSRPRLLKSDSRLERDLWGLLYVFPCLSASSKPWFFLIKPLWSNLQALHACTWWLFIFYSWSSHSCDFADICWTQTRCVGLVCMSKRSSPLIRRILVCDALSKLSRMNRIANRTG